MAAFPEYDAKDVAEFTGRPEVAYPPYTEQAIKQATFLFKMATCLREFPDNDFDAELAKYAILSVAEGLVLAQPYQTALASPFQSESLGSYSYSKISGAIQTGVPTGLTYFDSAVQRLGVCDVGGNGAIGGGSSGGIQVFDHQGVFGPGYGGNSRLYGPEDTEFYNGAYGGGAPD